MFYLVKAPWLIQKFYSDRTWKFSTRDKKIWFTFDDGPNPETTPFILEQLAKYDAKATFFCVGQQVEKYPDLFHQIRLQGHSVGNHTYSHLNGWKTKSKKYFEDVQQASSLIESHLFRPPYGRLTRFQAKTLTGSALQMKIVMWDVLSGDFDTRISPEHCYLNVVRNAGEGSIVVFHDSTKSFPNTKEALPESLKYFKERGFVFEYL